MTFTRRVMTALTVVVLVPAGAAAVAAPVAPGPASAIPWPSGDECVESLRGDLGPDVTVIDGLCLDGWAYVDLCPSCGGDTQQIVRFGTDRWEPAVAFPTPMCRAEALATGMPQPIVDRIGWQCDGGAPEPPPVADEFPLRVGSAGQRVAELQRGLQALGFDVGPSGADGHFGPDTEQAVRNWQASVVLPGTGEVYEPSYERIVGASAPAPIPAGAVDPANMLLPAGVCPAIDPDLRPAIPVHDGRGQTHGDDTAADWAYVEVRSDSAQFVDVDGDGVVETVAIVMCYWGGSGSAYLTPVVTLRLTPEGAVALAADPIPYHSGDLADQAAHTLSLDGTTLVVEGDQWLDGDFSCCPSLDITARWVFRDGAWVEAPDCPAVPSEPYTGDFWRELLAMVQADRPDLQVTSHFYAPLVSPSGDFAWSGLCSGDRHIGYAFFFVNAAASGLELTGVFPDLESACLAEAEFIDDEVCRGVQ